MTLNQNLAEFRFNLETHDMMVNMGRSLEQSCATLFDLGFKTQLVQFMQKNRSLLNMVLLRLQLYSEQNYTEQKVRSGLSVLNNQSVNLLLDHLYGSVQKQKTTPPASTCVTPAPEEHSEVEEHSEAEVEDNHFDAFFTAHVTHTDDVSDSVKFKEMYSKFSEWWSNNSDGSEVPSKDELKTFLSSKLNQKIGTTVTHVRLD